MKINRREFLAAGIGAAGTSLVGTPQASAQSFGLGSNQRSGSNTMTLLFWDDYYLDTWQNLKRQIGQPELVPEGTFRDPHFWTSSGYPTIFRHQSGIWRMLYNGKSTRPDDNGQYSHRRWPLLAESDDGISWRIPDLTRRAPLPGRVYGHQVFPMDDMGQMDCYVDERADPNERIKCMITRGHTNPSPGTPLYTSPDGLTWTKQEGVHWRQGPYGGNPDPPSTAFWNEIRGTYIISARPTPKRKPFRVSFSETKDWKHFTDPELVMMTDALDTPLAELYACVVFPYEGKFVGLVWIFHCQPDILHKYMGGTTDCQLAYSYNGWHMIRSIRKPFIPNTSPGELGGGVIRPIHMLVDDDDQIRIYSSSSSYEHGFHIWDFNGRQRVAGPGAGKDLGAILLHKLRLDGFFYVETNAGPGRLGTRALYWNGGEARINVQSAQEARVQVTDVGGNVHEGYSFDDCENFIGDDLYWTPRWKNGRGLSEFAGKGLRLEIELYNARLYAIRGNFIPMSRDEMVRYSETGEKPIYQPGF